MFGGYKNKIYLCSKKFIFSLILISCIKQEDFNWFRTPVICEDHEGLFYWFVNK